MMGGQTYFMVNTTNRKNENDWANNVTVIFILDPQ